MSVSAISAVGSSTSLASVYAAQSPYLNGIVRTSAAAQAAEVSATSSATSAAASQQAIAAEGAATATAVAAPPFANPAIAEIGAQVALGQSLTPPAGVTPNALLGASDITSASTVSTSALATAIAANVTALDSTTAISNALNVAPLTTLTSLNSLTAGNVPTSTDSLNALNASGVLTGDSGLLVQSYGAVALASGIQSLPPIYNAAATPVIPPAAGVTAVKAVNSVA
jgi:hypothetical protein